MTSNGGIDPTLEDHIDVLEDYWKEIDKNMEDIEWVFEDTVNSDREHANFEDLFSTMQMSLVEFIPREDVSDVVDSLINIVGNFDQNVYYELEDDNEKLANNLNELSYKYGLPMSRRLKKQRQGSRYWSNINSNLKIRSNRPAFDHKVITDFEKSLEFDSGLSPTITLARHFIEQAAKAHRVLGEDTLSYIDQEEVEEIQNICDRLIDELDDYEEEEEVLIKPDELEDTQTDESE